MKIRWTKGRDKPGTMVCRRDDGTQTWVPLTHNFAQHDLAHYVVETTLGLRQSFFALIASGLDIAAFALPKEKRTFQIPLEAVQTEHIVGHLQVELADGALIEDFNGSLAAACEVLGHAAPAPIPPETLVRLRTGVRELWSRWQEIPPGGALELDFPAAGG
jgi:hypothetical protein